MIRSAGAWLYFNADYIRHRVLELVDAAPADVRTVVLDCSIVPSIDTTAGTAMRVLARSLKSRQITIALAELRDDVTENLKSMGAEQDIGKLTAASDNRRVFGAVTGRRRPADRRVTVNSAANVALPYCPAAGNDALKVP